jgi:nucleoside-diphosphate-sugar epimerase
MYKKKLLVLGGTGFVGSAVVKRAVQKNFAVIAMSRREPAPRNGSENQSVTWVKGDAMDASTIKEVIKAHGPFDACVHALGVLFDGQTSLRSMNVYVSGSKSLADEGVTYDAITRVTAFNSIESLTGSSTSNRVPFVFVSAAEAGWTFDAPFNWLQRYLTAKRAVEGKLLESRDRVRPVIMRPSLVWSWSNPEKVIASVPFFIGSAVGLPIVDRPVRVEVLAEAVLAAIEDPLVEGVKRYRDVVELARRATAPM